VEENNFVPRSVRREDYNVVFTGLLANIMHSISLFADELLEVAVYKANRETKIARAEDALSQELEKLQEE
jgi:hypothetical protein